MKGKSMEALTILKAARNRVAQGWRQGTLVYHDGSVCALGAIAVVSGWQKGFYGESSGYTHLRENGQRDAVNILASVISPKYTDAQNAITRFNDTQPRGEWGKKAVLKAFDKAIKQAKKDARPKYLRWLP